MVFRTAKLIAFFILPFFISVCDDLAKNDRKEVNCRNLELGLIHKDYEKIGTELDKLTEDLSPNPTASDPIGHSENLVGFTEQLMKTCEELEVKIFCYACVETNPPQSELTIQLDSSGTIIERIIDIMTPSYNTLGFNGIH